MAARGALIGAALAVLLAGGAPSGQAAQTILIGGGPEGGADTQAAHRICAMVNEHAGDAYKCVARPAPGPAFTIRAVAVGLMEFAFVQSDRAHDAVNGAGAWEGNPVADLRSVFGLHPQTVLLVTRADSGIADVADLAGRTVNVGNPGSGLRGNAEDVLRLYGIDRNRDIKARSLKLQEASRALVEGAIDALFCTVANPSAALAAAAEATPISIVPLESEAVRSFVAARPYYAMAALRPGTYKGVAAAVATYAAMATVVTSADVADDLVYDVVRSVFTNLDALRSAHPASHGLDREAMLQGLSAPLHAGAARYYREQGWL